MTAHDLKTWPEPFAALLDGSKRHEVRKNDRAFAVGDVLHLREWDPSYYDCDKDGPRLGRYTGRTADFRVTHLTPGGEYGLPADLCVMSVEPVHAPTPAAPLDLDECERDFRAAMEGPPGNHAAFRLADAFPRIIAEVRSLRAWQDSAIKNGVSSTEQHEALRDAMGGDVRVGASLQMEAARILAERRDRIEALREGLLSEADHVASLHAVSHPFQREHCIESARRLRALAGEG